MMKILSIKKETFLGAIAITLAILLLLVVVFLACSVREVCIDGIQYIQTNKGELLSYKDPKPC